jgi:hypothetical protein
MTKGIFITGTDTGCGKTEVTLGLMRGLQQSGRIVLGMKPVASGAEETNQGLRNQDALRILLPMRRRSHPIWPPSRRTAPSCWIGSGMSLLSLPRGRIG